MKFDLSAMAARKRRSRRPVRLAKIVTTRAQALDLFAVFRRMLEPLDRLADIMGAAYETELNRVLQQDSPSDLTATSDAVAAAVNRLILELSPELRRWVVRTETWHRGKWIRSVLDGLEIGLDTMLGPEDVSETIDAFLVRNTSLIRDVNEQARSRVADAVLRGFQERKPVSEVTKEIREATGFARKRARRIAGDQTVKLASALDAERQRQAGLGVWRWVHSDKLHPRKVHVERDGKLFADDRAGVGKLKDGTAVLSAPEDLPGQLPFCGCVRQAVLVFDGTVL